MKPAFEPKPGMKLRFDGKLIEFAPLQSNGAAAVFVYAESGKEGTIYKVLHNGENFALKVFYPKFQTPYLIESTKKLGQYKHLPGLRVADRIISDPKNQSSLHNFTELNYSVLMPWVEGTVWGNLLSGSWPISSDEAFQIAKALINVIHVLESCGLAHCDLSNNNFIIASKTGEMQLIDVERMYFPEVTASVSNISYGTPGYRTKWIAEKGLWGPKSDRFAAAILCAEIIAWQSEEIRGERSGDTSFFHDDEIGQNSARFSIVKNFLDTMSTDLSVLFERAWFAQSVNECPSIGEWATAVDKSTTCIEDLDASLNTNKIKDAVGLPEENRKERTRVQNANEFADLKKGLPKENSSRKLKYGYFLLYTIVGGLFAICFLLVGAIALIVKPSSWFTNYSEPVYELIILLEFLFTTTLYTAILAYIVGILQTLILRTKLKARKFLFSILSTLGSLPGGIAGGLLLYLSYQGINYLDSSLWSGLTSFILWAIAGLVVGIVSGILVGITNSLSQNYVMRNKKYSMQWLLFNLLSWSSILSSGWALSLGLNNLIDFPYIGYAIGSIFIMGTQGIGTIMFLNLFPQIEFS